MLGFVARYGSSKGMVAVPDFSGLTSGTVTTQLASSGLTLDSLSGLIATNNSLQGGKALSQQPAAGTLVDYETPILVNFGNFIADTITTGPCETYGEESAATASCEGKLTVYANKITKRRKTITVTNNITGVTTTSYDNNCTDRVISTPSAYVDGSCGYVTPPTTCTATTNYGAYSVCNAAFALSSSGTKERTVSGTNKDCSTFSYTQYTACCQAVCGSWSPWSTVPSDTNKEQRARTCQNTDCTTYLDRDSRCKTNTVITYGGCGSKKTRIRTTKVYDACTGNLISSSSTTISCNAV
jgi:hypothetical protein